MKLPAAKERKEEELHSVDAGLGLLRDLSPVWARIEALTRHDLPNACAAAATLVQRIAGEEAHARELSEEYTRLDDEVQV